MDVFMDTQISDEIYFITSVTYRNRKWFNNPDLAQLVVNTWKHYENRYKFYIYAYSVMPDHYHILLAVGSDKNITQILHAVNSYTATKVNKYLGKVRKRKIWQGRPWYKTVSYDFMFWQKLAYILLNPFRGGLIDDPLEKYSYSNITEWIDREGEDFVIGLFFSYKRQLE